MYDPATVPIRENAVIDGELAYDREWFIVYTDPDYWYRRWRGGPFKPTDTVPDDFDLRQLTADYHALTTCTDDQVGTLMAELAANGFGDDTIVVFVSDHGDNLGSHGLWNKGQLIEESIRVPLIIWKPDRLQPQVNTTQVAQLIDVMPTLLGLTGHAVPDGVQGRDLTPVLTGEQAALADNWAFIETISNQVGIRTPTHLYGTRVDGETHAVTDSEQWFFDQRSDPYQYRNLAGTSEQGELATTLRERLLTWHAATEWLPL
jgi:choline-sulfatase